MPTPESTRALRALFEQLKDEFVRTHGQTGAAEWLGDTRVDEGAGQILMEGGRVLDPGGDPEGVVEFMNALSEMRDHEPTREESGVAALVEKLKAGQDAAAEEELWASQRPAPEPVMPTRRGGETGQSVTPSELYEPTPEDYAAARHQGLMMDAATEIFGETPSPAEIASLEKLSDDDLLGLVAEERMANAPPKPEKKSLAGAPSMRALSDIGRILGLEDTPPTELARRRRRDR